LDLLKKHPKYNKIKGIRLNGISGAALTYMYCYNLEYEEIPYFLKLISDYDCWQFNLDPDTTNFIAGIDFYDNSPFSDVWINLLSYKKHTSLELFNEILEKGKIINEYIKRDNSYYREHFWYETTLEGFKDDSFNGIKAAVVNKKTNSKIFGELYNKYELVIAWVFDGENYVYTFYSKKDGANCQLIAEALGGGGHVGAAGCRLDYLKFKKTN
jgi:uncharacterized protein